MADDVRPRGPEEPDRIGRYRITSHVGRGAMGVVYAAYDDAMGRPVAVKVLMSDLEHDPETRTRFKRDAQAAAGLLHTNIITIYDAGEDRGRLFIAMQLLEGWPLAQYLAQPEATTVERKLDLMVQMCEGLTAAHEKRIVHRDLKPGNLFVQSDGVLKILDFGVARIMDSSITVAGARLGTPDYMSPEQARGEAVDLRSDIFSTGAVFYYMLAGRKPFPGPDLPAVLRQLQFDEPEPLRDVEAPAELARIVSQAMAKSPNDRPSRIPDLSAQIVRFRRQFQAETRRLTVQAGAKYTAVVDLAASVRRAATRLELGASIEVDTVAHDLQARFPTIVERGGAAFETMSLDRGRAVELLSGIDSEQRRLESVLQSLQQHVATMTRAEEVRRSGDVRAALRLFEGVLGDYPTCARARRLAAECLATANEQDARERRFAEVLQAAQQAVERRQWSEAIRCAEESLTIVRDEPAALALLAAAQQNLAREERRKGLLLEQALERAMVAIDEERFSDADRALTEAAAIDPEAAALADARQQLESARQQATETERVRNAVTEEIRRSRAAFRRGRYHDAITSLRTFVDTERNVPDAVAEVERLEALSERMARGLDERRRRAATLLSTAREQAARGALDQALDRAREAVRLDANGEAAGALAALHERDLERRLEDARVRAREQRERDAQPLLLAARDARARGYLAVSLDTALAAAQVAPQHEGIRQLVAELRHDIETDDAYPFELTGDPFGEVTEPAPPAAMFAATTPASSTSAASMTSTGTAAASPAVAPASPPPAEATRQNDGALAQLNHWASSLLKRHSNR